MSELSFLHRARPLLTAMIQKRDPDSCITAIRNAVYSGADAIGLQICEMERQYRTEEEFRRVFSYCGERPVYVTNYRQVYSVGITDAERVEDMLLALRCGATLLDLMGDLYGEPEEMQLTDDPAAVKKQKQTIEEIHRAGGEVLMSSHIRRYLPADEVLEIAKKQEERGTDIVKIVTWSNTREELLNNLETTIRLERELHVPFLFLTNGAYCSIHRIIGPVIGMPMLLCLNGYENHTSKEQILLREAAGIYGGIDWQPYRA